MKSKISFPSLRILIWSLAVLSSAPIQAAPYAVYDLDVRGSQYRAAGISSESLRHIAVLDLDPDTTDALTVALVVPADGAVYLSNKLTGIGTAVTRTSKGAPRAYTTVSMNVVSHPTLENFIGHLTGAARNTRQTLVPARKAGSIRGVPVTAAPAVILNDLAPAIQFAPFLSGAGHSPVGMTYNGQHEELTSLGMHRLTLRLNRALTSVANQSGGAYAPASRSLPARAMPTVDEAGSAKAFLEEVLLALNYAQDDIVDLEPVMLQTFFRDADLDGYGDFANSIQAQTAPAGYVANSFDCDDADADANPVATEVCDTIDNNCNGMVDDIGNALLSDNNNCGACFNACPLGFDCVSGLCSCTPTTCAALGRVCGSVDNGCGQLISCGTCDPGKICVNGNCVSE